MQPKTYPLDFYRPFKLHFPNAAVLFAGDHVYVLPYTARTRVTLASDLHKMIAKNVSDHKPVKGATYICPANMWKNVTISNSGGEIAVMGDGKNAIVRVSNFHFMIPSFNNEEYHFMLWMWLAKNPQAGKSQWPNWRNRNGFVGSVFANCFACHEVMYYGDNHGKFCFKCPLKWSDNKKFSPFTPCMMGEYFLWKRESDHTLRSALARKIAYLKRIKAWG